MNTFDTFPRRNLPPESEPWGRAVEDEIYRLENGNVETDQSVNGLNRNTAATLQDLAKQVSRLDEQVVRLNNLYNQLPKGSQATSNQSNFAVLGSGWRNIASVRFTASATGRFSISANAVGRLQTTSTTGNFEVSYRLVSKSSVSPSTPGIPWNFAGAWQNTFSLSWGWEFTVTETESVEVAIQANPVDPANWPASSQTYATLQADASFTVV